MPDEYVIPGQIFKPQADFFVADFSEYLASNPPNVIKPKPYPIDRIFDIFPIRPEGDKNKTKITKRGVISISGGNLSNNHRVPTSSSFVGDGVGQVSLALPKNVSAVTSSSNTSLSISFDATPIRVRMTDLAPKLGYKLEMLLSQLIFEPSSVRYVFKAENATNGTEVELVIIVDFNKAEMVQAKLDSQKFCEGQQIEEVSREPMFAELFSGECCVVKPGSPPPEIPKDWKQMCQVEFQFVRAVPGGTDPGSGYRRTIRGYGEAEDEAVKDAVKRCEWQYKDDNDKYNYCQSYRKIDCQSRSGS